MGLTVGVKGYRLWCLDSKKIILSRDVTFDESIMLKQEKQKDSQVEKMNIGASQQVELEITSVDPVSVTEMDNDSSVTDEEGEEEVLTQEPSQQQDSIAVRRPRREIRKPARFVDMVAYALPIVNDDVPSSYKEAIRSSESNYNVQNNCSYTVWAAAEPGGGRELKHGQEWVFNTDPNFIQTGRIWARTNCEFDAYGIGKCETGDCNGALYCNESNAAVVVPPYTLAEYVFLRAANDSEFFHISLLYGFNVPMEFRGTSSECTKGIKCVGDINGLCPTELRHSGGCYHPCTVFKNKQFCCDEGKCETGDCNGTLYCLPSGWGKPPYTLAEYTFRAFNNNTDFFDISLVLGFNVPMEFRGTSSDCSKVIKCVGYINGFCPTELRHSGGCYHPCTVFNNKQFCCLGTTDECPPTTAYFKFFKGLCPNAYSFAYDDKTAIFTCPTGTDYKRPCLVVAGNSNMVKIGLLTPTLTSATKAAYGHEPIANLMQMGSANVRPETVTGLYTVLHPTLHPPRTLAEYAFREFNNLDFFDVSLMEGFNVPLEFRGTSSDCTRVIKCTADINGLCPTELRHSGGCYHPCAVFKNNQFCCNDGNCGPTAYSQSLKDLCPDVYTYPMDDATSTFTCPNGADYKVVFCPN
ncbi:hypothetical protein LWI29_036201 [Acer saccharum]|uniref:Retroviral polymerase SH3-like domain-containing protein n=1 Tax=Acer saccharum TaxID=4024 RepID=A0AA39VTT0_ACESA|nr:hypothetical protein LWI29_036201 [Acer saccharum]